MSDENFSLEEWNARLGQCGCCTMPTCPGILVIELEGNQAAVSPCGRGPDTSLAPCADDCVRYRSLVITDTRTGGDPSKTRTITTTITYERDEAGNCESSTETSSTGEDPSGLGAQTGFSESWSGSTWTREWTYEHGSQTVTWVYTDPVTMADMEAEAADILDAAVIGAYPGTSDEVAVRLKTFSTCSGETVEACPEYYYETQGKYRFRLLAPPPMSYYYLEWDEVFYPDGWGTEDYEGADPTITPKAAEWTGPGTGDPETDASFCTAWSALTKVPDGQLGRVSLRNVRYTCTRGTHYGAAPTYWGESYP